MTCRIYMKKGKRVRIISFKPCEALTAQVEMVKAQVQGYAYCGMRGGR